MLRRSLNRSCTFLSERETLGGALSHTALVHCQACVSCVHLAVVVASQEVYIEARNDKNPH